MDYVKKALEAIEAQQKGVKERGPQWMVGEQLKDICRREPKSAELICQDLAVKEMSLTEAEKKIKAFADKHKVGSFACVTPMEAEKILREFYKVNWPEGTRQGEPDRARGCPGAEGGLGHGLSAPETDTARPVEPPGQGTVLDLSDFL